jgi:hypothetical protein
MALGGSMRWSVLMVGMSQSLKSSSSCKEAVQNIDQSYGSATLMAGFERFDPGPGWSFVKLNICLVQAILSFKKEAKSVVDYRT